MKITDLLANDLVYIKKKFASKEDALLFFAKELKAKRYARSYKKAYDLFCEREAQVSTGVGQKIAMPHIRNDVMKTNKIFFAKVEPLDWDSPDNQHVEYVIGIAMSKSGGENAHLEVIANLSKLMMQENFVKQLGDATKKTEILALFAKYEAELFFKKPETNKVKNISYDIVAVTACPTGIAHTFMAAERLEKVAHEQKISIKVETQGTQGAQNALTTEEIQSAKCVILALDRAVDTWKFKDHANVLETTTRRAIHDTEQVLQDALSGKGSKLKNVTQSSDENQTNVLSFEGFGKRAYRSILTGVSYMLPFVIFGGILIAIAFLIDLFYVGVIVGDLNKIDGSFGAITNVSSWFKKLGSSSFNLMIPVLAAYITFAIVGKVGLLPGFIVGLMATGSMNELLSTISIQGLKEVNSGFFGAIGGAFLAATLIIIFTKFFAKATKSWQGIINILIIPLFGTLLIATIFWFVNIPFQYLNQGFISLLDIMDKNSQYIGWLLGMLIGIMMAIDLGGPINKAAYVFGTTSLATVLQNNQNAGSMPMAAAIVAGMVPPLAIALSTIISRKHWTSEERKSAQTNWVLGFSFISEGAIPFTAAKPKIMVLANIVGGASAGLIVGILGVGALAPHGGIFILPLFRTSLFLEPVNQLWFGMLFMLFALIVGVIVQAILLKFLLSYGERKRKKILSKNNLNAIGQG